MVMAMDLERRGEIQKMLSIYIYIYLYALGKRQIWVRKMSEIISTLLTWAPECIYLQWYHSLCFVLCLFLRGKRRRN